MSERPRNRNWVWYFAALAILGALAAAIPLVYNLRQQLTLPALQAARALWQEKGPKSYDLEYSKHGSATGLFFVKVRDGKVESVIMKMTDSDAGRPLEPRALGHHDILGLMEDIERFLEMDQEPNAPRAFNRAIFDPKDGRLVHYVRSVSGTGQRLEIRVNKLESRQGGHSLDR